MSDRYEAVLREVCSLPTAPFVERAVACYVRRFVAERKNLSLREDRWGNLLVSYRRGRLPAGGPLVLMAHMDHPGFVADKMVGRSRVLAQWFGGVDAERFKGEAVRFFVVDDDGATLRTVAGRVGKTTLGPPMMRGTQQVRRVETAEITVESDVPAGSPGMWDFPDARFPGRRVRARACDDLAEVAAMLCVLDELHRRGGNANLTCAFTRAEEVGFVGAIALARDGTLDNEATFISLECSSAAAAGAKLGGGPILRVGDMMTVFDRVTSLWIENVGRELSAGGGFAFQKLLMPGGSCEATALAAYGYRVAAMALALGNYHNHARGGGLGPEYIDRDDYAGMIRWLTALAAGYGDLPKVNDKLVKSMEQRFSKHRKLLGRWQ